MKFSNNYKEEFATMKLGRQVLKITEATYDDDFGCVSLKLTSKEGANLYKAFYVMNDGEVNEGVKRALDFIAWKALGHRKEYEESDLEGCYLDVDVILDEYQSEKKNKKIYTIDLWETESASGFGKKSKKSDDDIDLDAELG